MRPIKHSNFITSRFQYRMLLSESLNTNNTLDFIEYNNYYFTDVIDRGDRKVFIIAIDGSNYLGFALMKLEEIYGDNKEDVSLEEIAYDYFNSNNPQSLVTDKLQVDGTPSDIVLRLLNTIYHYVEFLTEKGYDYFLFEADKAENRTMYNMVYHQIAKLDKYEQIYSGDYDGLDDIDIEVPENYKDSRYKVFIVAVK